LSLPSFFTDFLQSYPFWLFDVAPIDQFGLPLFLPIYGFSRISAPEMTATVRTIKEGNWHYQRKVVNGANVSPITMERGVFWADSEFWRWIQATIQGTTGGDGAFNLVNVPGPTPRRNLLLVHFFSRGPFNDRATNVATAAVGLAGAGAAGISLSSGPLAQGITANAATIGGFLLNNSLLPRLAVRIPAKAWLLCDCIPTRYKAASDFDAMSSAVSLQEIDFEYERFEEIGLAA